MATTFVKYEDRYVQVPESIVTIIGYMLFYEGELKAETPSDRERFVKLARDFDERTIGVGCTRLGLDDLLARDPAKEAEVLALVSLARKRIANFGGRTVPPEYLDSCMPITDERGESVTSDWWYRVLDAIEAVIRGKPMPPDYPLATSGF